MEEYQMENSDSIWQWCRARKKLFTISKIHSMADGFSSVAKIGSLADGFYPNIIRKGNQCIEDYPLRRSAPTLEGNLLKSRDYCRDMCLPVQNSIAEVREWIFEEVPGISSSTSATNSDTMSDHPHCGQLLRWPLGIADENSVDKQQPPKLRARKRGQKAALKQNRLFSDERMTKSSGQYAACNREPSVEVSSSCSISKVLAEDIELQSVGMEGEMRDLSSNFNDWPCQPPRTKKPKKDQVLVSETGKNPFQIENEKTKSEILFPGLHLLADAAVRSLQNDESRFPKNITQKKGNRKLSFIPTGVPFLQKTVVRRAKSALKHHQRDPLQMLHALHKNLSAANSKRLLTSENICKPGEPACIKQTENQVVGNVVDEDQMAIPQLRCSKRGRSQALPSKYCDSVLQPWKRGTRINVNLHVC